MAVIYVDVEQRSKYIMLGEQGEKNAVVVKFDISTWLSAFGSGGSAFVDVERPGDETAYTKQIGLEGNYAVWSVDDIDNAVAGKGKVQLTYLMPGDDGRSKTATFVTMVDKSLDASGDVPDPYESYLEEAREIRAETTQNAQTAQAAAQAASTKAGEASTSASEAYTSARSAKISEENAERSASTASEAAEEILDMTATATTLPEGSEATVDYNNGVMAFGIPRGDTGAKGAKGDTGETGATPNLSIGTVETLAPDEDATATITGTAENPVLNLGLPKGETGDVSKSELASLMPLETVSGSVARFSDGSEVFDAEQALITLEPIQSGSGTPSPDNVRPISGHTECVTHRTGKNLWGGLKMAEDIHEAVPNSVLDTTAKTISYEASAVSGKIVYSDFLPNTQYTIILRGDNTSSTKTTNLSVRYTDGTYTNLPIFANGVVAFVTDSAKSVRDIRGVWATSTTTLYYDECGLFEGVLTADDFEPYQGTTYTTALGRTVYGGTVDLVSGVLTVDRKYAVIDEPNSWEASTGTTNFRYMHDFTDRKKFSTSTVGFICSCFPVGNEENNVRWRGANDATFGIVSTSLTMEQVKALTESGDFAICYDLATPQTYQLTPQAIALLTGDNNVWSEDGNIEVKYRANIGLYVDKKISEVNA